jgi:ribosome-associated protein
MDYMDLTDLPQETHSLLKSVVRALDDRKAEDLKVLYVGELSSITDFFILASGNSEPHLRALLSTASRELKDLKVRTVGSDSSAGSGWAVIDAFDVMIHLFLDEQRDFYQLDELWKDASVVDSQSLLAVEV